MLSPFFVQAALSPGRQQSFRQLSSATWRCWPRRRGRCVAPGKPRRRLLGHVLLTAGIVEGTLLIGWRLAQLPKSQALEFFLVSPVRPQRVLVAEALVGITRLALVTLAGLPVLLLLARMVT